MESTKPDPKNFTGFLKEKEKPVSFKLVPPWLTGNIPDKKSPSVATTAVANVKPIDDLAFKNNAADLFGKEFQSLKSDLEKLKTETSKPLINVELETLKLKEIDPSRLLTVRFTLDMRDFSITDDEQPSIVN